MADMNITEPTEALYQVGVITQTHGIKGEVKVFPLTDDVSRFRNRKDLILDAPKERRVVEVVSARPQKNLVICKFKGIDSINEAERYKGCGLYVTKENRVACGEDEYFIADLIGLAVMDEAGETLGVLDDVLVTGANDVYVVRAEGKQDILLPAITQCVLDVDMDGGKMTVHLLPGLERDV